MTTNLGEFERISRYFTPLAASFPGALGLTDDAAILDPGPGRELIVSTDSQVSGIHFFGEADPALIAAKILRSSVSDLAAMGADPLAYTLAAFWTGTEDSDWLRRFSFGLAHEQAALGITLAGGDTVKASGALSFSITVFGDLPKGEAIRRAGAQAGDLIAVTGTIGDAWLGRRLLENPVLRQDWSLSNRDVEFLTERYWRPAPRCQTLALLRGRASAAIDISDGLIADLSHIAFGSGIGMELDAAFIPLSETARRLVACFSLVDLITGGDDYEIALTIPSEKEAILKEVARMSGVPITVVGRCLPGSGVRARDRFGGLVPIERTGFRHF